MGDDRSAESNCVSGKKSVGHHNKHFPQHLARDIRALLSLFNRVCSFVANAREVSIFAPHLPPHQQLAALLQILGIKADPLLGPDTGGARDADAVVKMQSRCRGEAALRELAGRWSAIGAHEPPPAILELAASLLGQLALASAAPHLYVARVDPKEQVIQIWLMAAEGTLANVADSLHSLILMSGTLTPLASTVTELGPSFARRALKPVVAGHVVGPQSLKFAVVSHSATTKLECTFRAWKRREFLVSIGEAIVTLCRAVPGGVLVFLPSYEILERCAQAWQCPTATAPAGKRRGAVQRVTESDAPAVWKQLLSIKRTIVLEPSPALGTHTLDVATTGKRAAQPYEAARRRYEESVQRDGCALLLAVYRGRMSEGVSFDDDFARGVICVGIPFPNLTEERLVQKRAFNDYAHKAGLESATGDAWYESKALHAVAQALGRCIRHPRDYGCLVLLDSRWTELGKARSLPQWLHPFIEEHPDAVSAAASLATHFEPSMRNGSEAHFSTNTADNTSSHPSGVAEFGAVNASVATVTPAPAGCFGASLTTVQRSSAFQNLRSGKSQCIELE